MKLKFLENINAYGEHAIRLNDFNKTEANKFLKILKNLVSNPKQLIHLSSYSFIIPINCSLTLRISETDEGIITEDNKEFFCDLTIEAYKEMILLLEPFCVQETNAYRYLYELDNPIDFLFSAGKEK